MGRPGFAIHRSARLGPPEASSLGPSGSSPWGVSEYYLWKLEGQGVLPYP